MSQDFRAVATTRFGGVRLIKKTKKGFSWRGNPKTSRIMMSRAEIEDARVWAKKHKAKTFRVLKQGDWSHLRLDPTTKWPTDKKLLTRLNTVGQKLGRIVYLKSGHRTLQEQTRLYNLWRAGQGNRAAYPNQNAPHIRGVAADCGIIDRKGNYASLGLNSQAKKIAESLGLRAWVPGEPWHWQRQETY